MSNTHAGWHLGKHVAPPRFILFCIVLALGLVVAVPALDLGRGILAAFDVASAIFLVSLIPLLRRGEAAQMRAQAKANDANRVGLLGLTGVTMIVVLVAVASELQGKPSTADLALVVVTLVLAWLFSNIVYALHYAHLFYLGDEDGEGDRGGLDFPDCDEPDYWDFLYFSFTFGVALATSDVQLTSRKMRHVAIGQCLAGYVFNIGVIAFTISVLSGG